MSPAEEGDLPGLEAEHPPGIWLGGGGGGLGTSGRFGGIKQVFLDKLSCKRQNKDKRSVQIVKAPAAAS